MYGAPATHCTSTCEEKHKGQKVDVSGDWVNKMPQSYQEAPVCQLHLKDLVVLIINLPFCYHGCSLTSL